MVATNVQNYMGPYICVCVCVELFRLCGTCYLCSNEYFNMRKYYQVHMFTFSTRWNMMIKQ